MKLDVLKEKLLDLVKDPNNWYKFLFYFVTPFLVLLIMGSNLKFHLLFTLLSIVTSIIGGVGLVFLVIGIFRVIKFFPGTGGKLCLKQTSFISEKKGEKTTNNVLRLYGVIIFFEIWILQNLFKLFALDPTLLFSPLFTYDFWIFAVAFTVPPFFTLLWLLESIGLTVYNEEPLRIHEARSILKRFLWFSVIVSGIIFILNNFVFYSIRFLEAEDFLYVFSFFIPTTFILPFLYFYLLEKPLSTFILDKIQHKYPSFEEVKNELFLTKNKRY